MPSFPDKDAFIEYLEETLIPDLKEAGSDGFVQDFEEAIEWMRHYEINEAIGFVMDRPHRFKAGDVIRHVDSTPTDPANRITVEKLTVRITDARAYPTYVISAYTYGMKETVYDVLDTDDLVPIS